MVTDFELYESKHRRCATGKSRYFDPALLRELADEIENGLKDGTVVHCSESDPDNDEYQGYDFVFELRASAGRIEQKTK